jgi:hypothetical protein
VLDRVDAEIATRAAALYEAGNSAPAADVITRNQHVSAAEARRREKRAEALARAKQFGDALAAGSIGAEHADVLANVSAKLHGPTTGRHDRRRNAPAASSRQTAYRTAHRAHAGSDDEARTSSTE